MPSEHTHDAVAQPAGPGLLRSPALRLAALVAWTTLLVAFWLGARGAQQGPLEFLIGGVDGLASQPWAPLWLLGLYLLRPLLLVPITVLNLATGLLLGAPGIAFALLGTLLSATAGYGIGRFMGSNSMVEDLSSRWSLVRVLRARTFESVLAGGLMYLHADLVNLPSGLLRVRFPTFLLAISLGNALTMTTAVLAGASVEGSLAEANIGFDLTYLALAAGLFTVSLVLAYLLRRRMRASDDD